jgi:hypothetical protein
MLASIKTPACQTQDSAGSKENRRHVCVAGSDGIPRRQAVDDHCPSFVDHGENREGHAHRERELESSIADVLALIGDGRDEEEEISGS